MASQADVGQALQGASVNVMNLKVKDVGGTTAVYGSVASEDDKRVAVEEDPVGQRRPDPRSRQDSGGVEAPAPVA